MGLFAPLFKGFLLFTVALLLIKETSGHGESVAFLLVTGLSQMIFVIIDLTRGMGPDTIAL